MTREQLLEIIDPEAMDGFERALSGCIEMGQPLHLAHHYARTQWGARRDAAFVKADAILVLATEPAGG